MKKLDAFSLIWSDYCTPVNFLFYQRKRKGIETGGGLEMKAYWKSHQYVIEGALVKQQPASTLLL